MRTLTFLSASLVALGLPYLVSAEHGGRSRRHDALAKRQRSDIAPFNKRATASGARATYYDTSVGLGACGNYNPPSAWTVALAGEMFRPYPSAQCGRGLTISWGGKTAHAIVQDECPVPYCSWGQIDLSQGLFEFFAPTSTGVLYVDWWWDGEGGNGGGDNGGGNNGGGDNGGGNNNGGGDNNGGSNNGGGDHNGGGDNNNGGNNGDNNNNNPPPPPPPPPPPSEEPPKPSSTYEPPPPPSSSYVPPPPPSSSSQRPSPTADASIASASSQAGPQGLAQLHLAALGMSNVVVKAGSL